MPKNYREVLSGQDGHRTRGSAQMHCSVVAKERARDMEIQTGKQQEKYSSSNKTNKENLASIPIKEGKRK